MRTLTKKTTILFSPDIYNQLEEMAKTLKTSVAELIRRAIVKQYLLPSKEQRMKSVEHLVNIGGDVSDWEHMEEEITKDKLDDCIQIAPLVLSVNRNDILKARHLLQVYNSIAVRDAIHAAVMLNRGIKTICSYDKHFDQIKEIKRIEP